jgi:hypothetical protein
MGQRIIVRAELMPRPKAWFDSIREVRGMTQIAAMSRLLEWYAEQPHAIQVLIMGQIPESIRDDVVRIALRKLDESR